MAGSTTIEEVHPDVLIRAFSLLDGPALAVASCATSHLRSLSAHPDLWRDLCLSAWPSLRDPRLLGDIIPSFKDTYRSFFAHAYPFPSFQPSTSSADDVEFPRQLMSVIDLYYKGTPILSKVIETETSTSWFHGTPFRIDVLGEKDHPPQIPAELALSPSDLTLSWVVIDPARRQTVNISSRRPVAVERQWYTGEYLARFVLVAGEGRAVSAVVTCGEEMRHVREVSLTIEDADGISLNGRDSLAILKNAMEGDKRGRREDDGAAAAKVKYAEHVRRKMERKEMRVRKERRLDLYCIAVQVSIFFAFCAMVAFR